MSDPQQAAHPEPQRIDERSGFFNSLLDTRFDHLITPRMIRFVYIVLMVLLAVGLLISVIAGFSQDVGTGLLTLVLGPIFSLLYLIFIRIFMELIIVTFKIREAAEAIAENTDGAGR
jgi:hypothetical protein